VSHAIASMGPRLESRGEAIDPNSCAPWIATLQWGRGSKAAESSRWQASRAGGQRFNGAAARKPRRVSEEDVQEIAGECFNGAAARKPRRAPWPDHRRNCADHASMGPRLESRGEGVQHGSTASPCKVLQWGRGSKAAESSRGGVRLPVIKCASMGPRLESRGELGPASGGPVQRKALQWGRGSKAAERMVMVTVSAACTALQWGRGSKAAERGVRSQSPARCPSAGFNGAAARKPRRAPPIKVNAVSVKEASMGPRLESRGEKALPQIQTALTKASMGPRLESRGEKKYVTPSKKINWASMGPRLESRGERRRESTLRRTIGGFNGAAARKPRRVGCRCPATCSCKKLQWGRGSKAAESFQFLQVAAWRDTASMGPRLESRGEVAAIQQTQAQALTLQWGRGSKAAERARPPRNFFVVSPLQWGRGSKAAERASGQGVIYACGVLQWGRGSKAAERLATTATTSQLLVGLQWGRGSKAAESGATPRCPLLSGCFNGAAARKPRRVQQWAPMIGYGQRFNGAAARKPRRGAHFAHRMRTREELQWGRGSKAAEREITAE